MSAVSVQRNRGKSRAMAAAAGDNHVVPDAGNQDSVRTVMRRCAKRLYYDFLVGGDNDVQDLPHIKGSFGHKAAIAGVHVEQHVRDDEHYAFATALFIDKTLLANLIATSATGRAGCACSITIPFDRLYGMGDEVSPEERRLRMFVLLRALYCYNEHEAVRPRIEIYEHCARVVWGQHTSTA